MLGKLARWLRILGYDTAYERLIDDERLVERVLAENRWLLTRDRFLARRRALRGRLTLLTSDHVPEQLQQLARDIHLDLRLDASMPRCPDCNRVLEELSREAAAPRVPLYVAQTYAVFAICPACGRIFWPGTHWAAMLAQLERLKTL
jgi:hypothetical protein